MTCPDGREAGFDDNGIVLPAGMSVQMYWRMCDVGLGLPVPLAKADLTRTFIYDRAWGVFFCPLGTHQAGMALLLAWQHGLNRGLEVAERLGLDGTSGAADHWLENTPGAVFRSFVSEHLLVGKLSGLTPIERRVFGAAGELMALMD